MKDHRTHRVPPEFSIIEIPYKSQHPGTRPKAVHLRIQRLGDHFSLHFDSTHLIEPRASNSIHVYPEHMGKR